MGRFGNIARTDGTSRAARAIGRGPHRGRGSKVNANRAPSANPARMNFADSDPGSAAVCRERFRLALVGPEAAADADQGVRTLNTKTLNTKGGKNMRKSLSLGILLVL